MGVCVLGFVRLCRQGVDELIEAFPHMLQLHQNGMVIFIHCRSGHSRGPAFRKGWFFVGGASSFFGFGKRGGGVGRRVSTLVCPEVFWFESSEPLQLSSRAKGFFSTPATRDHQHDASADTNFLESCVGGPLREMPLWTGTFGSTCLAGKP